MGADSLIGRNLIDPPGLAGGKAIGTTRRREGLTESRLFLDLDGDVRAWRCEAPLQAAVLCAGVTSIDACRLDPATTSKINVDAVCTVAEKLLARGVFLVYLSSQFVFDGTVPYAPTDLPPSPQSAYGRQKAEVEARLLSFGNAVSVVRLSKVFGPGSSLLMTWTRSLVEGIPIQPFSDYVIAPVGVGFVRKVIERIIVNRVPGIIHVSASSEITYAEAARHLAMGVNMPLDLVRPVRAAESGIAPKGLPRYAALNTDLLRNDLGFIPPHPLSAIEEAVGL